MIPALARNHSLSGDNVKTWLSALPNVLLIFIALIFCMQAQAHNRSQSFSSWVINSDEVEVVFTVKTREVTRLPLLEGDLRSFDALLTAHLRHSLSIDSGGIDCDAKGLPFSIPAAKGYAKVKWSFNCPAQGDKNLNIDSFFSVASSHIHYAQWAFGEDIAQQYLFTNNKRSQLVGRFTNRIETFYHAFLQYAQLGISHIFSGWDHLAFLLALMLLFRRLRDVIWTVSGFTLGHSVTLSLAGLGWVQPDIVLVEALIGFTIIVVAAENIGALTKTSRQLSYVLVAALGVLGGISFVWGGGLTPVTVFGLMLFTLAYLRQSKNRRSTIIMRCFLTFVFGLIHGFGFAGVLGEIGLPEQRFWSALTGFNIGVELGQLMIVGVAWFIVSTLRKLEWVKDFRVFIDFTSALLLGLGSYWFLVRSFNL